MRVLLINPPYSLFPGSNSPRGGLPLGTMYIASILDRAGHEVRILDTLMADVAPRRVGDIVQYGMPWEDIGEALKQFSPQVVGISSVFSAQMDNASHVAQIVKDVDKETLVVTGGNPVSSMADHLLMEDPNIDVAVIGEGEFTMLELADRVEQGSHLDKVNGIAYREGTQIHVNVARPYIENLDDLPFPAYHLVDMEQYFTPKRVYSRATSFSREMSLITSRGCPYNCLFCTAHVHMGKKWRAHSTEYVLRHIEHVIARYHVERLHFEDDCISLNLKRFEEILDGIIAKGLKFQWDLPNGIRVDTLSQRLLEKMRRAGLVGLNMGVESGSQRVLDEVIDKRLRLADVIEAARLCKQTGIRVSAFYIVGFPGETKEEIKETLELALMLRRKYGVGMVLGMTKPFYGTRLYQVARERGLIPERLLPRDFAECEPWGRPLIETEEFTAQELQRMVLEAYKIHHRLAIFDYLRRPWSAFKGMRARPREASRFIRSIAGLAIPAVSESTETLLKVSGVEI